MSKRYDVFIAETSRGWQPESYEDCPPLPVKLVSIKKQCIPRHSAEGICFGYNAGAMKDPKRKTWAVAVRRLSATVSSLARK
jgi:hypothetical protein